MLYTEESIINSVLEQWKVDAVARFSAKLTDKNFLFPCIPATQGYRLNQFRYGFVSDPRNISSADELAKILEAYSNCFRNLGNYTSLIIFYDTSEELKDRTCVETFEQLFWKQVNRLTEIDYKEWPRQIHIIRSGNSVFTGNNISFIAPPLLIKRK
ncbi:FPC/CPF motif-containing protein YcgG [Neobacillus ginsengisoli]|uniref:FPC/CPF motif-containing protein YcgG n=1 Tax=Neobacillus ginsengisoli TaxID=904295 RepID=A0ABT9XVB2_9BACI|nr:FPC/CPF motif-containing protein YcgG [Neobacillus ginsengisoli]